MKKVLTLTLLLLTLTLVYATPIKVNVFYKGKLAEDIIVVWFTINNLGKQHYLINIYLKYIKQGSTVINATINKTYIFAVKILNKSLSNASPVILIENPEVKLEILEKVEYLSGVETSRVLSYALNKFLQTLIEPRSMGGKGSKLYVSFKDLLPASIEELEPDKVYSASVGILIVYGKHQLPNRTTWQVIIPLSIAILAAVIVILLRKKILSKFSSK